MLSKRCEMCHITLFPESQREAAAPERALMRPRTE